MTRDELAKQFAEKKSTADDVLEAVDRFLADSGDIKTLVDLAIHSSRALVHACVAHVLSRRSSAEDLGDTCRLATLVPTRGQLGYTLLTALLEQIESGARPNASQMKQIKQVLETALADRDTGLVSGTAVELLLVLNDKYSDAIPSRERGEWWNRIAELPSKVRADWSREIAALQKAWSMPLA